MATDQHAIDDVRSLPKVLLHDHFDGGLRPRTVIELARDHHYRGLPTQDPDDLAAWFHRGADRRSLELYLETFVHTLAVLRTPDAVERVAFECAQDLAADGVVYAESRFAPELVAGPTMSVDDAIRAMRRGFDAGAALGIELRTIVCSMRDNTISAEAAHAAARNRDEGVVGFDIAGPEAGYPPSQHIAAFEIARAAGLGVTIHAGEADGLDSIREALDDCNADRLGHGVHLIDDFHRERDGEWRLGDLATTVLGRQICLEVCPTSNVHTGAAGAIDLAHHPIDVLARSGLAVTVNTDNRLMSNITLSDEYEQLARTFGWGEREFTTANDHAVRTAFCDESTRRRIRDRLRSGPDARPS